MPAVFQHHHDLSIAIEVQFWLRRSGEELGVLEDVPRDYSPVLDRTTIDVRFFDLRCWATPAYTEVARHRSHQAQSPVPVEPGENIETIERVGFPEGAPTCH